MVSDDGGLVIFDHLGVALGLEMSTSSLIGDWSDR